MNNRQGTNHFRTPWFILLLLLTPCLPLAGCSGGSGNGPLPAGSTTLPPVTRTAGATELDSLLAQLRDPDPSVRSDAAVGLGGLQDARAVEPLIAALQDVDPEVRLHVNYALGELKDARAVVPLVAELADWDTSDEGEAAALKQIGAPAVEPLIAILKDPDYRVQDAAGDILAQIGSPAVDPLIAVLKGDDGVLRAQAARVLGEMKMDSTLQDVRPVEPLIAALQDKDRDVQEQAIWALQMFKDARAIQPLVALLGDNEVGSDAAFALADFGDPAIQPLAAALQSGDSQTRSNAAIALEEMKAAGVEPLIVALQAEDPAVRREAVYTLGEIKDARAVQPLIALLKDPDQLVRSETAQVLGDMQDPQAVEPLSAALQDKSIQNDVIEALTKLNDPRAIPALIAVMRTGDLYYCTPCFPAEKALVKLGAPAVQPLNAALQDASPNVRRWSAKALQQIGDERSVAPLIAAIQRGDVEVAAGAYIFFIEKGLGGSETVLVQALDKYAGMDNDGGQKMAEDFLNSGNSLLEAGARKWASTHQYRVTQGVGTGGPRWGSAAP